MTGRRLEAAIAAVAMAVLLHGCGGDATEPEPDVDLGGIRVGTAPLPYRAVVVLVEDPVLGQERSVA
jgi:hypothetical protein